MLYVICSGKSYKTNEQELALNASAFARKTMRRTWVRSLRTDVKFPTVSLQGRGVAIIMNSHVVDIFLACHALDDREGYPCVDPYCVDVLPPIVHVFYSENNEKADDDD